MINKVIHYCWFGRNPLPEMAQKCIASWKQFCPDYKIIEWNEDNFDISASPVYVRQAYEAKQWAFVTDYVRLKIVYDNGGIYMDTDVELIRPLDEFLRYGAYFGFEDGVYVNTGLGFGAEKGSDLLSEMMADYNDILFLREDGTYDKMPCPQRNTGVLLRKGLQQNNERQVLEGNILILPSEYLCPIDYMSGKKKCTAKTVSIHWFAASWQSEQEKQQMQVIRRQQKLWWRILYYIIRHGGRKILGEESYERLKKRIKG